MKFNCEDIVSPLSKKKKGSNPTLEVYCFWSWNFFLDDDINGYQHYDIWIVKLF